MGQKDRSNDSNPAHKQINTASVLTEGRGQWGKHAREQRRGDPELWVGEHGLREPVEGVPRIFPKTEVVPHTVPETDLNMSARSVKDLNIVPATLSHLHILTGHVSYSTIIHTCE